MYRPLSAPLVQSCPQNEDKMDSSRTDHIDLVGDLPGQCGAK